MVVGLQAAFLSDVLYAIQTGRQLVIIGFASAIKPLCPAADDEMWRP